MASASRGWAGFISNSLCVEHNIDDAYPVCFILPPVPDIALSDNESHTFKQSSMPQI